MKLYSGPLSLFTAKVRIALREKGLACDLWSVPFCRETGYEPKPADVKRLHPQGLVPILVDDDLVIYDSTQILEYLEERNPEPPLYPRGLAERARCRQTEAYADEVFFPRVWPLIEEVFYKTHPAEQDSERIANAHRDIAEDYVRFDEQLRDREWFCGSFSVADIGVILTVNFASNLGCPPPAEHSALHAWLERMQARPAVGTEVEHMTADAARVFGGERLPQGPGRL